VECRGLDQFGFLFFQLAFNQVDNTGLFASPPTNVPSNTINITHKDSKEVKYKVLGCFSVAVVSRKSITIQ
jgi:hypothetical protein